LAIVESGMRAQIAQVFPVLGERGLELNRTCVSTSWVHCVRWHGAFRNVRIKPFKTWPRIASRRSRTTHTRKLGWRLLDPGVFYLRGGRAARASELGKTRPGHSNKANLGALLLLAAVGKDRGRRVPRDVIHSGHGACIKLANALAGGHIVQQDELVQ